jgi:hypothetical protein
LAAVFVVIQPFASIPKVANADALNPSPAAVVGKPQFTGVVAVANTDWLKATLTGLWVLRDPM